MTKSLFVLNIFFLSVPVFSVLATSFFQSV
jgi:hypothetical protein